MFQPVIGHGQVTRSVEHRGEFRVHLLRGPSMALGTLGRLRQHRTGSAIKQQPGHLRTAPAAAQPSGVEQYWVEAHSFGFAIEQTARRFGSAVQCHMECRQARAIGRVDGHAVFNQQFGQFPSRLSTSQWIHQRRKTSMRIAYARSRGRPGQSGNVSVRLAHDEPLHRGQRRWRGRACSKKLFHTLPIITAACSCHLVCRSRSGIRGFSSGSGRNRHEDRCS